MASLCVNGEMKQFDGEMPATMAELLERLGVDAATVVAELEGQIIKREDFGTTALSDGQRIELVRFVPGG